MNKEELNLSDTGTWHEYKIITTGIYKWTMSLAKRVKGIFLSGGTLWR